MEDSHPPPRPTPLSSEVTGDSDSRYSAEQSEDFLARDAISTEWTDEKHRLYLKSMEASFVNQLHNSLDLLGWHSKNGHSSDAKLSKQVNATTRVSSGQFKVLRGRCWGKINFERDKPQLDKANGSRVLLANPWIRHFKSASRRQVVASRALREKAVFESKAICSKGKMALTSGLPAHTKHFHVHHPNMCCHDPVGSHTEVSDQNFVDEDLEGDKASHVCATKRTKTNVATSSSNDQVVPISTFPVQDVTKNPPGK